MVGRRLGGSRLSANRCEDAPASFLPTGASRERSACRSEALQVFQPFQGGLLPQQPVIDAAGIQRTALLVGELVEVREELLDLPLDGYEQPDVPRQEVDGTAAFLEPSFI